MKLAPVLFLAHGSPMNAIADNSFTQMLLQLGQKLATPKAILCISAHWFTRGTQVSTVKNPPMIYDMLGFPQELYQIKYQSPGYPKMFDHIKDAVGNFASVSANKTRGYDHGMWSIFTHLHPHAKIPVAQMSIDFSNSLQEHYDLAKKLITLREQDIMIVASGNITHNLNYVDFNNYNALPIEWAQSFDLQIKKLLDDKNHKALINYATLNHAHLAVPEPSHFIPLIYTIGLQQEDEKVKYLYQRFEYSSLSMRSFQLA